MRLLCQEMRKIWHPAVLAAILLLGMLYYYVRPAFYIEYFSNGPYRRAELELAAEWVAQYGPTLERQERTELDGQLAEARARFKQQVAAMPDAAAAGVTDYESFRTYEEADSSDRRLVWRIIEETDCYTVTQLQHFLACYDYNQQNPACFSGIFTVQEYFTPQEQARVQALEAGAYGLLPYHVYESTGCYFQYLAVWTVLGVILLLSPTLVRDRLHRVRPMQWASRRGRRILHTQFAAGLLSALGLTALNLLVYGLPFLSTRALVFQDCPLFDHFEGNFPWFDWTYGQFLLGLTALVVLLGLGTGLVTLFLSQYSGNYVAMLLKAIPLFLAVGAFFAYGLLDNAFFIRSIHPSLPMGALFHMPKGGEFLAAAILLALGGVLWAAAWGRQRRRQL